MAQIDVLLERALACGASDLHLRAGSPPLMRLHGRLKPLPEVDGQDGYEAALLAILTESQRQVFEARSDLDFAYEIPQVGRFRVNFLRQHKGVGAVFRLLPSRLYSLEELGLPQVVYALVRLEQGLVLVTGPTGSGKSTTLAAIIDHINQESDKHIVTIEDPLEFIHPNKKSLVTQREVGAHTTSFAAALRAVLREDPDIILLGELRDLETISLAITAAEIGHLVFGTLHTRTAASTVDRLIDVFPPEQQSQIRTMLAETLKGVIAQQLLVRADGQGRVVAVEILVGTTALANLIREGKTHQIPSLIQTGRREACKPWIKPSSNSSAASRSRLRRHIVRRSIRTSTAST